jgi:hypothetical protein
VLVQPAGGTGALRASDLRSREPRLGSACVDRRVGATLQVGECEPVSDDDPPRLLKSKQRPGRREHEAPNRATQQYLPWRDWVDRRA